MNGPEPASTAFQGAAIPTSETVAAVAKGVTAWAAVGISSWHDVAAVLAAVYTALLIIEWVWKRLRRQPIDSGGAR